MFARRRPERSLSPVFCSIVLALSCSSEGNQPQDNASPETTTGTEQGSGGSTDSMNSGGTPGSSSSGGATGLASGGAGVEGGGATGGSASGDSSGSGGATSATGGSSVGSGGADSGPSCPKPEGETCHEFFANDNTRHVVLYVNEFDPSLNWSQPTQNQSGGNSPRQLQLVENKDAKNGQAILVSVDDGYEEYDYLDHELLASVSLGPISVRGAHRLADGNTLIAHGDAHLRLVDPSGKTITDDCDLPGTGTENLRILSRDPQSGLIYYGRGMDIFAVSQDCEQKWTARFSEDPSKAYLVVPRPEGGAYATTGYPGSVVAIDEAGQVVAEWGGKDEHPNLFDFSSGFDLTESGNLVVASWWGHVQPPPQEGPHLVEFNAQNEVVWRWGTQAEATHITNVLVVR